VCPLLKARGSGPFSPAEGDVVYRSKGLSKIPETPKKRLPNGLAEQALSASRGKWLCMEPEGEQKKGFPGARRRSWFPGYPAVVREKQ